MCITNLGRYTLLKTNDFKYLNNRAPYQYKDGLSLYEDFHYKDKAVVFFYW